MVEKSDFRIDQQQLALLVGQAELWEVRVHSDHAVCETYALPLLTNHGSGPENVLHDGEETEREVVGI